MAMLNNQMVKHLVETLLSQKNKGDWLPIYDHSKQDNDNTCCACGQLSAVWTSESGF